MADRCFTLEELNEKFLMLINSLKQKMVLRDGIGDVTCNNLLLAVESGLSDAEVQLKLMKHEISRRKQALQNFEVIKQQTLLLQARQNHVSENIPQRMPRANNSKQLNAPSNQSTTPRTKQKMNCLLTPQSMCSTGSNSPTGVLSVIQIKKKAPTLFVPTIDYIMVQEFESVPKYMRGRMNYAQVNTAIDEFNKAVTGKYSLMATKRNKQNDRIKNAIWDYKQQETKDTKGVWFITDADMKEFGAVKVLKPDSVGRATLTILRHCNRMREIRTKGLTRYAVVAL